MMKSIFKHHMKSQNGSIVTVLMMGIAVLAAMSFGAYQFITGPLSTTAKVNQNNAVKTQMTMTGRSAILDAAAQSGSGDCDLDGFIEPRAWRDAAGDPAPTNGGLLPEEFGMPLKDTWGMDYGYCAWDVGTNAPVSGENVVINYITTAYNTTCAVNSDKTLWCWGTESNGELADGGTETDSALTPTQSNGDSWQFVGQSYTYTTCGIKTDGSAWCWGKGNSGQLGNGASVNSASPVEVSGGDTWKFVTSGGNHSCGIKTDGTGWCWGAANNGALGSGATSGSYNTPQAIAGGGTWKKIEAGSAHTCGIKDDDEMYCWGVENNGRLGNGSIASNRQYSPVSVTESGPWVDISLGGQTSCAVKGDGTAWCWGYGQSGSLGDGVGGDHAEPDPVQVTDPGPWESVGVGFSNACGVKSDGSGWCWGQNAQGTLGDGTKSNHVSPEEISGSHTWSFFSLNSSHSCGIRTDRTVMCWGQEDGGQLGNGATASEQLTPITIGFTASSGGNCSASLLDGSDNPSTGASYTQSVIAVVSAGPDRTFSTTCNAYVDATTNLVDSSGDDVLMRLSYDEAAAVAGDIWSLKTGDDTTAQIDKDLEIGTDISFDTPNGLIQAAEVNTLGKVDATGGLQLGNQTDIPDGDCTVSTAGTLRYNSALTITELCTGAGGWITTPGSGGGVSWPLRGPDGNATAPSYSFTDLTTGGLFASSGDRVTLYAPAGQSVSLEAEGSIFSLTQTDTTVESQGAITFVNTGYPSIWTYSVAGSDYRVISEGGVQIGDTTLTCASNSEEGTIKYIPGSDSFEYCDGSAWQIFQVPAGGGTGCADDDATECTLAIDRASNDPEFIPENIAVNHNVLGVHGSFIPKSTTWSRTRPSITVSQDHSCAIKSDGRAYCWGYDEFGKLGNGATTGNQTIPSPVDSTDGWIQISAGELHTCGIKTDGSGWCWGEDTYDYNLGNGPTTGDQVSPSAVAGTGPWLQIEAGSISTCGIKYDGTAWCWGADNYDQLGNGTTGALNSPSQVSDAGPWTQISIGYIHGCGVKADGTGWCWGSDSQGALGNGASGNSNVPIAVGGGPWKEIVAGHYFTCGIKADGTLWCWGDDDFGQLANGSGVTGDKQSPYQAADVGPWISLSLARYSACGLKTNGTAWCWGYNGEGQLGLGTVTSTEDIPMEVSEPGPWVAVDIDDTYSESSHACGLKADGSVWCWGTDVYGELGNGDDITGRQSSPTLVLPPTVFASNSKTVFVTSQTWNGNLGGIAGADAKCGSAATTAGLSGTYKAWVSDSANSPSTTFVQSTKPYKLLDGTTIADNWADLVDGSLDSEIDLDENGSAANPKTWTGVSSSGGIAGARCNDWTDGTSGSFGRYGTTSLTVGNWTDSGFSDTCDYSYALYCFEQ